MRNGQHVAIPRATCLEEAVPDERGSICARAKRPCVEDWHEFVSEVQRAANNFNFSNFSNVAFCDYDDKFNVN